MTKHMAALLMTVGAILAHPVRAEVITPGALDGWQPANVRSDGSVAITSTYARSGNGSLEFSTNMVTNGQDKADFVNYWGNVAGRTLGNLSAISYDLLRDASSVGPNYLAPAFRLAYDNGIPGQTGYLIYEPVYNGYQTATGVPTNQFVTMNIAGANFWMREFSPGLTIEKYDVTLAAWMSGTSQAPNADVLTANTLITGIEVGVGSGWNTLFHGAVDNVLLSFGRDSISANFETAAVAVPEPASMTLLAGGLVFAGLRRRRASTAA